MFVSHSAQKNYNVGIASTTQQNSPARVGSASDWSTVRCGNAFAVGLKTTGLLWAWGFNNYGQLGGGTTNNANTPQMIGTNATWQVLAAGYAHTLALREDAPSGRGD